MYTDSDRWMFSWPLQKRWQLYAEWFWRLHVWMPSWDWWTKLHWRWIYNTVWQGSFYDLVFLKQKKKRKEKKRSDLFLVIVGNLLELTTLQSCRFALSQLLTNVMSTFTDIVNECESAPCRHGGTCKDRLGHFECECPTNYLGRQCELGNYSPIYRDQISLNLCFSRWIAIAWWGERGWGS